MEKGKGHKVNTKKTCPEDRLYVDLIDDDKPQEYNSLSKGEFLHCIDSLVRKDGQKHNLWSICLYII